MVVLGPAARAGGRPSTSSDNSLSSGPAAEPFSLRVRSRWAAESVTGATFSRALARHWPGKLVTKQIFRRVYLIRDGKLLGKACVKSSKKRKNKRMKLNISSLDELLNLAYSDDLLAAQLLPILPIR